MKINPETKICGLPSIDARDFMLFYHNNPWFSSRIFQTRLKSKFKLTDNEAESIYNEFLVDEYIERVDGHYDLTSKGKQLAKASYKHTIDPNKTTLNLNEAAEFIDKTSKELTFIAKGLQITGYKLKGRWAFDRSVLEIFNKTGRDPDADARIRIYVDNAAINSPYRINPADKSESQFKETGTKFRIVKTDN